MAARYTILPRVMARSIGQVGVTVAAATRPALTLTPAMPAYPGVRLCTSVPKHAKEWLTVTYERGDGSTFTVQGKEGDNMLDIAVNNDLDLDGFGACEGTLACSTCHLVFKEDDFKNIEDPCTDEELDMLDLAYGLTDTRPCISLSGCGFLGLYLLGALDCLRQHSPSLLHSAEFCGASAGALLGASILCDLPINTVCSGWLQTAMEVRKQSMGAFTPGFRFERYLKTGFDMLPLDAHVRTSGRLHVSVTRLQDLSNVIISEWGSREELIQTLRCSCYILGFSGMQPPMLRGERYIDGGYSNKQPVVRPHAITISPYSGRADICPKDGQKIFGSTSWANASMNVSYANMVRLYHTLMPPPAYVLNRYYHVGFSDALYFLRRQRQIKWMKKVYL